MSLDRYVDEIIVGEVVDYTHEGYGVLRHEGIAIFVRNVIIGQIIKVKITKAKKRFLLAEVYDNNDLISDSVICDNYYTCGGCDIMHMKYEEQIKFKSNTIMNTLRKQKILLEDLEIIENSEHNEGYRNKSRYFIRKNNGIFEKFMYGKDKRLKRISYCYLQTQTCNEIIDFIVDNLEYINKADKVNQIEIIESKSTKDIIVTIMADSLIKVSEYFIDRLILKFEKIKKINVKYSGQVYKIYEKCEVIEHIGSIDYVIDTDSFFQVNTTQAYNLIKEVLELGNFKDKEVLDAYCGSGFFSLAIASEAKNVVGIELNSKAIEIAKLNKVNNGINNANFIVGDIEKEIGEYHRKKVFFDTVVVDPPRKGLEKNFIDTIFKFQPQVLIYVSCNPATLARDLSKLLEIYMIETIKGLDMFSHTHHVEVVTKLKLK